MTTAPAEGAVHRLSEDYVERFAALDPITATFEGIPGHDEELTDYSPDGINERRAHAAHVLRELDGITTEGADEAGFAGSPEETAHAPSTNGDDERVAAEVLRQHLGVELELIDNGEELRALRVISSPVSGIRLCFDLMPRAIEADWAVLAARTAAVPQAIDGFIASLQEGIGEGLVAAERQVRACTMQADTWGGVGSGATPFFLGLLDEYDASDVEDGALRSRLAEVARRATDAYAALGRYLVEEYLPHASPQDAVGADRYATWAEAFTGVELDLAETYAWGWDELHRLEHALGAVGERILPGEPLAAVIEHLEHDPTRRIEGEAELQRWLQDLMDHTIADMNGTHFDIPEPVQRVEAMIAPPGGAAAMYYTGPSEDFSRPGRTWYPTLGRTTFPLWGEVSICYHEGVPGHHLQIGMTRYLTERLNRFQRTLAFNAGHAEGWALYAERLMGELGYLEDPAYELGMLRAQAMRAARVVVDIGLHLELTIPDDERFHPGERWTPELAIPFMIERSHFGADFATSEVDRYLGWPGQAICYKVGERSWLRARDEARRRHGDSFDLKAFHTRGLELGPMGLHQLEAELARF